MSEEQYNELLKAYTKEALVSMIKADIRSRFPEPIIVAEKNGQLLVCSLKEEQRIKEFGK